jgi:ferredoxin
VKDLQGVLAAQAAGYGGGSLIYANVHLRPPPEIFAPAPKNTPTEQPTNEPKEDPRGWPAIYSRRTELDPYYDIVAAALRVRPLPATLGAPSPVTRLPKVDALRQVARELGRDRWFFMPPLAIDFGKCIMCAECVAGCQLHAKNTLDLNYLAEAEKSPDVDVRTLAEVVTIRLETNGTYTVTYLDHITGGSESMVQGKSVFLCAGAVNSTDILLRSRDLLGIDEASKPQIGRRFFSNGDAIAMVFDTINGQAPTPTVGPTIATTLLYNAGAPDLRSAPDAWFVLQDGGYPRWLEPALGLFRGEFWLERNRLTGPAFAQLSEGTGEMVDLDCGLLFRSIGYRGLPLPGVPFDSSRGVFPNTGGRIDGGGGDRKWQAEHPAPTGPRPGDLPRSSGDLADRQARPAGPQRPLHLRADGDRRPVRRGRHADRHSVHAAHLRRHA